MSKFTGNTEDAGGAFLGADFWKKGKRIEAEVLGDFDTASGKSWNVKLSKPEKVGDETTDRVSIGGLKGLAMAIRASGAGELQTRDRVIIECTGTSPTSKGSPMINFKVLVDRP